MYIPENCKSLKESDIPQIRLGIQGWGGTGKTWAALTFPNPIVFNIDNGLGAHAGREDVIEVKIWSKEYCAKIYGANYTKYNLRDVIDKWFDTHGPKLEKGQTLIVDGNTGLQNAYHLWYTANIVTTNGKIDGFAEYKLKQQFFTPILESFKYLKCDVVYLCHESEKKEKSGQYEGKVRPLLSGSVGAEILTHFTDWFRQHASDKPILPLDTAKLKLWGLDDKGIKEVLESYKGNTIYYWQTEGDDVFDAKRSSLVDAPRFIPAHYNSFLEYRRKPEESNPMAFHGDISNLLNKDLPIKQ